jgi:Dockerin type I domain
MGRHFLSIVLVLAAAISVRAQDVNAMRDDQINRLKNYVVDAMLPSGLVRDSLVLDPAGSSFHPATPDAAGFELIALSALDHMGKLTDAQQRVIDILSAHAGLKPGVVPERSADGHFIHFMNISTGAAAGGGWDDSYSPISTALLVAGAQFARNHFSSNATIASLTQQLTNSVNFNAAIHPSLTGGIYLDMTKAGGGAGGTVRPFNEFMLVESLALREANNQRALAVKHRWLDTDFIPKIFYDQTPTLTDNLGVYAPAFWVQQMHFFNGDFRHSAEFEDYFAKQQQADKQYSATALEEAFRYGLTAGVIPNGYHADRIGDHPFTVFSPEAVAAWGDMNTLLSFYVQQNPTSNPRYRYGMVRVSADQPGWIPPDAGLVDHMFLLFGLVESLYPNFFADRVFPGLEPGDYNGDGVVDAADYTRWRSTFGAQNLLAADGNGNGAIDAADYVIWRDHATAFAAHWAAAVPEPGPAAPMSVVVIMLLAVAQSRFRAEEL